MFMKTCEACGKRVNVERGEEAGDGLLYHSRCLRRHERDLARQAGGIHPRGINTPELDMTPLTSLRKFGATWYDFLSRKNLEKQGNFHG